MEHKGKRPRARNLRLTAVTIENTLYLSLSLSLSLSLFFGENTIILINVCKKHYLQWV